MECCTWVRVGRTTPLSRTVAARSWNQETTGYWIGLPEALHTIRAARIPDSGRMAEFSNPVEVETGGIKAFSVPTQACDGDGFDHNSTISATFSLAIPSHNARIIMVKPLSPHLCVNTNSGLDISSLVSQVICSLVARVLFSSCIVATERVWLLHSDGHNQHSVTAAL